MTIGISTGYAFPKAGVKREARRRFVVRLVLMIFVLSLIEGPLRKWFLPGMATPLTLLRDPFVIILYAYCIVHGMIWKHRVAKFWLWFAAITSVFGLAQYAASGFGLQHWILGVRTYWLYMPLAFVVAQTFRMQDIHAFLRLNMLIAIPYALLVAQQYNSPPFAFINYGVGADEEGAVGLGDGILRPFGLFTYTGPNVQFTAAMVAMFIAFYLGNVTVIYRKIFILACGAAVCSMTVLTGSRSIYFLVAMILSLTAIGLFIARPSGRTLRRILGIVGFVVLAAVLFVLVFPDMLDAMTNRLESAARSEGSIWTRALSGLFAWVEPMFTAPFLGAGIGAGAPGVARFLGLPPLIYGESDMERNVNELGVILGIAMLGLRMVTAVLIAWLAYRLAKRGAVMALPLAGFVFFPFLLGQITHSPLSGFLVWLLAGIIFAQDQASRRRRLEFHST